jgi:hypothetical protein
MKKMIIYIVITLIVLCLVGGLVYYFNMKVDNETTAGGNMRFVTGEYLYNSLDKRVLTNQGKDILLKAIEDEDYTIETKDISYDKWKASVEKGIWLHISFPNWREPDVYIIPTGLDGWIDGQAFLRYDRAKINKVSINEKVDIIKFNDFKLIDFLNEDPNFVREIAPAKRPVSLMLKYSELHSKIQSSPYKSVTYICEKGVSGLVVSIEDNKISVKSENYGQNGKSKVFTFNPESVDSSGKFTDTSGKAIFGVENSSAFFQEINGITYNQCFEYRPGIE